MRESTDTLPGGRIALRFEPRLAHPREKVWRALTEIEQLRSWFIEVLDYDRSELDFAAGAKLSYVSDGQTVGRGGVTAYDPPALLEYTWDAEVLRFELVDEDAGCVLIFTNVVDGPEIANAVTPGWRSGLDRLAQRLDHADAIE